MLNHRKQRIATVALIFLVLVAGCRDPQPSSPPAETTRPVEILEITASEAGTGLRFPGRVRAVQRAELAFNVPGQIVAFPVKEGQTVAAGTLIARLDPAVYDVRLAAARAEFEKARTDYERVRQVWERSQAVARAEVDQKRTTMEVARSSYAAARNEVEDTRLTAPFAGVIARRYIENFQNIQAKEPIVSLQNVNELEIVIHVPERVVRNEPKRVAGVAEFEGIPDRRFPVALKAFATEADPQTQTYEVVLGLVRPDDVTILPGMSAEVFPEAMAAAEGGGGLLIPVKAVVAGPDGTPTVWVVDAETSRVGRRIIVVGELIGERVIVLEGLSVGERIATAGVHHLRDGMRVRPL